MTDPRSSRWFQLSLKSLFLLVLVVAAFFGGYSLATKHAEQRQASIEAQRQEEARRIDGFDFFVAGSGGIGYGVGDFDGDGQPDLIVASPQASSTVYRNLGDGKFQAYPQR